MDSKFSRIGKRIKKSLYIPIYVFLQVLCLLYCPKNNNISKEGVKRILIYGYTGIGNMILFTPVIRAVRKHFSQASITLLVGINTGCQEVVSGSNLVDEIIDFSPRRATVMQTLRFIKRMRDRRFDLLVSDFHGSRPFLALLTVLGSIPYRVGHSTSPGWRNKLDYVYNFKVEMAENEHEIDRDLRLAYAVGIKGDEVNKNPIMWIGEGDREFANEFLRQNDIDDKDLVIGVQVGINPAMRWKQWNLDRYAQLCDRLVEDYGAKVVLLGSQNEMELTNYVRKKMKHTPIVAAGKTTVKQAAAIIERCRLFICSDSGLMHVSAAVNTPVVAIYGPTDYHRTHPYGNGHIVIRKNLSCSPCFRMEGTEKVESCRRRKCLELIGVDDVLEAAERQLFKYPESKTTPKS